MDSGLLWAGLDAAQGIVGVIVKVVNKTDSTITVTPGGNNATILVNQELSKPIPQLSEVRGQLPAGSQTNFTVLFPLVINSLEDKGNQTESNTR